MRKFLFVLLLSIALFTCVACAGGSDSDADGDSGTDGDSSDPDGDNPDGDNPDGDDPDGDNPDGDEPDGDNDSDNDSDGDMDDTENEEDTEEVEQDPIIDCIFYVDATISSPGNGANPASAFASIQPALNAAATMATETDPCEVRVAAGSYFIYVDGPLNTITLKPHVSLLGGYPTNFDEARDSTANETVLDGRQEDAAQSPRVYHVVTGSNHARMGGFTIRYGNAHEDDNAANTHNLGGGMFNTLTSPTVANCLFELNEARYGGAVYNTGGTPAFENVTFSQNSASEDGGAVMNATNGNATFVNPVFTGNTATRGAGLFNAQGTVISMSRAGIGQCLLKANAASEDGGGIYADSGSTLLATGCVFQACDATGKGGGLSAYLTTLVMGNCAFVNNSAEEGAGLAAEYYTSATAINCSFAGNTASTSGGAIALIDTSAINIVNGILWDDTPEEIAAGAGSSATVSYSSVETGSGAMSGEGNVELDPAFVDLSTGNFRLDLTSPCLDIGNPDAASDAGLTEDFEGQPRVLFYGVDLGADEMSFDSFDINTLYVDADASGDNNGSSWDNAFTTLTPALNAAQAGDQIWVAEGTYTPETATDGRFSSFTLPYLVSLYGGFDPTNDVVLFDDRDPGTYTTTLSGDINGNDGAKGVGTDNVYHVLIGGDRSLLNGFTVSGGNSDLSCEAKRSTDHCRHGGGLYSTGDISITIQDCIFENNAATVGAGLVALNGVDLTLKNTVIRNNIADWSGGALTAGSTGSTVGSVTFDTCRIENNESNRLSGGAISISKMGSFTMLKSEIIGNSSNVTDIPGYGYGGGLKLSGDIPTVLIADCLFESNSADTHGGAIFMSASLGIPEIVNCRFIDNSATEDGGGVFNVSNSTSSVNAHYSNCLFAGNNAAQGGAMSILDSIPILTNCTMTGNTASTSGGAIYFKDTLQNSCNGDNATITNSILWDNTGGEIIHDSTQPACKPLIAYSDIKGGCTESSNCTTDESGNIGANTSDHNPDFFNVAGDDYSLKTGSPCINTGSDSYVLRPDDPDLAGNGRFNGQVDMGAYEYHDTRN